MLSKNKQKYIQSLQRKKIREKEGLFIVEGRKAIESILLSNFEIIEVFAIDIHADFHSNYTNEVINITPDELKLISTFSNPDDGLALVKLPNYQFNFNTIKDELLLYLDRINDPGNLGTIIRLADWFGIKHIFINKGTTDPYQSKCVQSTMGAISNVKLFFVDNNFLNDAKLKYDLPILATKMEGENVLNTTLPKKGVLIMGNEANGISDEIESMATHFYSIPKYSSSISESLNVAMSCGIILSHFAKS